MSRAYLVSRPDLAGFHESISVLRDNCTRCCARPLVLRRRAWRRRICWRSAHILGVVRGGEAVPSGHGGLFAVVMGRDRGRGVAVALAVVHEHGHKLDGLGRVAEDALEVFGGLRVRQAACIGHNLQELGRVEGKQRPQVRQCPLLICRHG